MRQQTVLGKGKGAQVDGHDLVVRFNYFRTAGFEKDVGRRTDLWFLGELKEPGPRGTRGSLGARSGAPQRHHPRAIHTKRC